MISFRPLMNSERFLHRESIAYASATFPGSRLFQLPQRGALFELQFPERMEVKGDGSQLLLLPSGFSLTSDLMRASKIGWEYDSLAQSSCY